MFKDVIEKANISLYKLSKESGVSYTCINELFRGERTIEECQLKTVKNIADALNISIDELYKESVKQNLKIPKDLKKCFWDTDIKKLDIQKDYIYIISRLLEMGGYDGLVFVLNTYTYEQIKNVGICSRNISNKTASFLSNTYNIKKENMAFYKKPILDWREI